MTKAAGLCMYCGKAFVCADDSPEEIGRVYQETLTHDKECEKNPLVMEIKAESNVRLALIEFVRNECADLCDTVGLHHFANDLVWTQEGVDPIEIAGERGQSDGAYECQQKIAEQDCYELLRKWLLR